MGGSIGALFLEKYNNYFSKAILNCPMLNGEAENKYIWYAQKKTKGKEVWGI